MIAAPTERGEFSRSRHPVVLVIHGAGWAGTERHVRGLLTGLIRLGWPVCLVVSERGPLTEEAPALGSEVAVVPRGSAADYVRRLADLLRSRAPHLVHAHSGRLPSLAARWARVPAIVETRHGLPERLRAAYRVCPPARRWEAAKCRLAHRTITVCRADEEWLRAAGLSAPRIRVVPNGTDLRFHPASLETALPPDPAGGAGREALGTARAERQRAARASWNLPETALIVGLVGRLSPQKAPWRFLEVLAGLREGFVSDAPELGGVAGGTGGGPSGGPTGRPGRGQVCGVVCGQGPEQAALEVRARELDLSEILVRFPARADARLLLPALDLLLLPSQWEGSPYIVLEALDAGVPVLATPVGGIPEILSGPVLEGGILPWSRAGWVRRARSFLDDRTLRDRWAEDAPRRAADFPEEATVAAVDQIYRDLLRPRSFLGPSGAGC